MHVQGNDAMIKRTQDCRVNINIKEASRALMESFIVMPGRMTLMVELTACQKRQFILYNWTPG